MICAMFAGRVAKCPFGLLLTRHCPLPVGLHRRTHASAGQSAPDASLPSLQAPSLPRLQLPRQKTTRRINRDTTHDEAPPAKRRAVLARPTSVQHLGHPDAAEPMSGCPLTAPQAPAAMQVPAPTSPTSSPNTRAMACGLDQVRCFGTSTP